MEELSIPQINELEDEREDTVMETAADPVINVQDSETAAGEAEELATGGADETASPLNNIVFRVTKPRSQWKRAIRTKK